VNNFISFEAVNFGPFAVFGKWRLCDLELKDLNFRSGWKDIVLLLPQAPLFDVQDSELKD
jgi:hypothetical protein